MDEGKVVSNSVINVRSKVHKKRSVVSTFIGHGGGRTRVHPKVSGLAAAWSL
jgi:hypothetical protein